MIIRVQKNMTTEIISLNFLPITKGLITKHKIVYSFYIMWHLPTMSEYCEEEMWVWLFPHHKCQKILSNHESKTSYLTSFWHEWCGKTNTHISDLTVFTLLKTTIMQIWQFCLKKLSNCCKVCTWVLLSLCKVCTLVIVQQFLYYSSF